MGNFSTPQNCKYLFIDMNSYFASCEQQANPKLRGLPVAVTPVNVPSGCVIAASYEAKKFGIKTGTLVAEAKRLCPEITICESNVGLYLDIHQKLVNVFESFSPFVCIKSIDEASIRLAPEDRKSARACEIALKIKEKIKLKMGDYMRASIGIGPNVWLAKMAAESQKPDGLFVLSLDDLNEFYTKCELTDLKGINFNLARQLNKVGIFSPIQIYLSSPQILRQKLGVCGEYWFLRMHGFDIDISSSQTKTIGHSHVLEPALRNWLKARSVCQKLIERAGSRLREEGLVAKGIFLYVRYIGRSNWHKAMRTDPFCDSQTFLKLTDLLWRQLPKDHLPLGIGIRVFNLSKPKFYQPKIFPFMQKPQDLYFAVDKANDKWGQFTIAPASILEIKKAAPKRISFGRPIL